MIHFRWVDAFNIIIALRKKMKTILSFKKRISETQIYLV